LHQNLASYIEISEQHRRGRSWRAETGEPTHPRFPIDDDGLRHDQGLRDHAHDPPRSLHIARAGSPRRSALHQQAVLHLRLIKPATVNEFRSALVNATVPCCQMPREVAFADQEKKSYCPSDPDNWTIKFGNSVSARRLWSDDGRLFHDRVGEGLPTIRELISSVNIAAVIACWRVMSSRLASARTREQYPIGCC
jgi:hypothetical protein